MKKLITITLLHLASLCNAQFFKEDFSRNKIVYSGDYDWVTASGAMLCNGGNWETTTDSVYIYGQSSMVFTDTFSYAGAANGFAKLWHTCDESISSVSLSTPLINVAGQGIVLLEYVTEFAGLAIGSVRVAPKNGPTIYVSGASVSYNAYVNTIDLTPFISGYDSIYIVFGFSTTDRWGGAIPKYTRGV